MSKRNNFFGSKSSYTARTLAFLAATGITDTTIANALNTMDLALIAAGLLPTGTGAGKIKALYPFVGGTATTHKFNFVNPADTDAAFRLTFSGGWTHSATGALPNGSTGYAETHLNALSELTVNDTHVSFYSRSLDTTTNEVEICAWDGLDKSIMLMLDYDFGGGGASSRQYGYSLGSVIIPSATSGDTLGLFVGNRESNINHNIWKNGVKLGTTVTPNTYTLPNQTLNLSRVNVLNIQYSNKECAFCSIGDSLTDANNSDFFTIVNNLQIGLFRNV